MITQSDADSSAQGSLEEHARMSSLSVGVFNGHTDKVAEARLGFLSRIIWPWHDSWPVPLVAFLAAMDHISTYVLLELSGKANVYESGFLASWALRRGGFNGLYIMDAVAVGLLCVIAVSTRLLFAKRGFSGFARTAYVAVLVPYAIAAFAAVVNNWLLVFI